MWLSDPLSCFVFRASSYKKTQSNGRSISPQKRIPRMKSVPNEITPRSAAIRSDHQYKSTIRIPSTSCESLARPACHRHPSPNSSLPMSTSSSCESLSESDCHYRGRKFAKSMPSIASLSLKRADNAEVEGYMLSMKLIPLFRLRRFECATTEASPQKILLTGTQFELGMKRQTRYLTGKSSPSSGICHIHSVASLLAARQNA